MGYQVVYCKPERIAAAGFGKVSRLPFIIDSRPGYHRLASRYLIDRGLGVWKPPAERQGRRARRPTRKSIENYARWLANFLWWAEVHKVSLEKCSYSDDLLDGYQADMKSGRWSPKKLRLKPRTYNPRVQQACDFLTWMAEKELRPPLYVPTETTRVSIGSARSSVGHRSFEVEQRVGKAPEPAQNLVMPADGDVRKWLLGVAAAKGPVLRLACESILLTAVRLSELTGLRVDTLPLDREDWVVANPDAPHSRQEVLIKIEYGAKGPDESFDEYDNKIGPERTIRIPLALAERWDEYRNKVRPGLLKKWVDDAPSVAEKRRRIKASVALFLNAKGTALTPDQVYRAWRTGQRPTPGWSPRKGRHWWACATLLEHLSRIEALKALGPAAAEQLLHASAVPFIQMRIQPQLGHADAKTTQLYLKWAVNHFSTPLAIHLDAALENGEEDDR